MDGNTAQPPLSTERGRKCWCGDQIGLFVVLVQCRMRRGWRVYLSKNQGGGKREERGKRWYDSDTPGVDVSQ